jgi:hypothetical protein
MLASDQRMLCILHGSPASRRRIAGLLLRPVAADNAAMDAEPPKADLPKPKRRRFQFSLRMLMVVVTVAALFCGYFAWCRKIELAKALALSRIHSLGGFALCVSTNSSPVLIYLPAMTTTEDRHLIGEAFPNVDTCAFRGRLFGPDGRLQFQQIDLRRFEDEPDR